MARGARTTGRRARSTSWSILHLVVYGNVAIFSALRVVTSTTSIVGRGRCIGPIVPAIVTAWLLASNLGTDEGPIPSARAAHIKLDVIALPLLPESTDDGSSR